MNPLLFIPSPRDIPDVKKWWPQLPYDKFVVKYKIQKEAYDEGKAFFLENKSYTHMVLCPDDLEIPPDKLEILLEDSKTYETICGYCNTAESNALVTDLQPLGCDYSQPIPRQDFGARYMLNHKPFLPEGIRFLEVGHCGSACRVISRELFERISFAGATGLGWWDWQISKDLVSLGVPNMIDLSVKLWHRREEQKPVFTAGYSYLWKK